MDRAELKTKFIQTFKKGGMEGVFFHDLIDQLLNEVVFDSELEKRLHDNRAHPDYEYDTTESSRDGEGYPPEGEGWECNLDHFRGYYKNDNSVDHYWRREKRFKLTDPVALHDLPKVVVPKYRFPALLEKLREELTDLTIAGGKAKERYTHKPVYCKWVGEFFSPEETGQRVYNPDLMGEVLSKADIAKLPFLPRQTTPSERAYIVIALGDHPFQLLIDPDQPEEQSWVRVKTAGGNFGPWTKIYASQDLPFHPTAWEELTSLI